MNNNKHAVMRIIKHEHRYKKIFIHLNVIPSNYSKDFEEEKEFH
jgi:hypothetical protein